MPLSFAHKKLIINTTKWLSVMLFLLVFLLIAIYWLIIFTPNALHSITLANLFSFIPPIISVSLGLYLSKPFYRLLCRLLNPPMDKYVDNAFNAAKGIKGENLVYNELCKILDTTQYKIKRNFKIPNKRFDFDFIIIGPKGLIVIDVKNHPKTHTTFTYDKAFYINKSGNPTELIKKDPRKKLKDQIYQLNTYFKNKDLKDIKIRKVLLYLNTDSIEFKNGTENLYKTFIIRGIDGLSTYFKEAFLDSQFTPEFSNKIYDILEN